MLMVVHELSFFCKATEREEIVDVPRNEDGLSIERCGDIMDDSSRYVGDSIAINIYVLLLLMMVRYR